MLTETLQAHIEMVIESGKWEAWMLMQIFSSVLSRLRPFAWDGGRYLGSDSVTAFISQAAFTPQWVVPSQVFASICSHFFLVSTTLHQTSLVLMNETRAGKMTW